VLKIIKILEAVLKPYLDFLKYSFCARLFIDIALFIKKGESLKTAIVILIDLYNSKRFKI